MGFINIFDIPGQAACSARPNVNTSVPVGGAMTTLPLSVWASRTDSSTFTFNDGGIKVNKTGNYLISAGIYYSTYPAKADYGIYVFDSNGTELVSTRFFNYSGYSYVGGVGTPAKIVPVTAGTTIYLKARCVGAAGTVTGTDAATFLTLVKM
jgi:hypothetical protein